VCSTRGKGEPIPGRFPLRGKPETSVHLADETFIVAAGERVDATRVRNALAMAYKRRITALRDERERGRPAGLLRGST